MNQPYLSQIVLRTASYVDCTDSLSRSIGESVSGELATQLRADLARFRETGLDGLDAMQKQQLVVAYSKFEEPQAIDVLHWLEGRYRFDPQCLTG